MAEVSIERLHTYQGQFLGALDFDAEQQYHVELRRRHNIGHHTWGIVVGLDLTEQPQEGGGVGVDLFVQPGLAIDGYGRELLVPRPLALATADFQRFAVDDHYDVWLGYFEEPTARASNGFLRCEGANQYNRTRETVRVFVRPIEPQPTGVMVDGALVAPPVDAADPSTIPPDLAVPYQELPVDFRSRWLIRLGSVHWNGSRLVAAAAGRLSEGRRYVGAVAATLLAPAQALTIRDRATDPLTTTDAGVAVSIEGSLQVERDITAKANLHVDGGLLDFRQSDGAGEGELALQRGENSLGIDLRVSIAKGSSDGANRLAIGSQTLGNPASFAPALVVLDNNNVGIHAEQPEHPLQIGAAAAPILMSLRGPDLNAEAAALAFEDNGGSTARWFKLLYNTQSNVLKVTSAEIDPIIAFQRISGRVGIGTDSPDRALTIYSAEGAYLNVRANDGNHEILVGADGGGGIVSTMTDHDLQLRAGGNSTKVTIKADGDVGIGTTNPNARLEVRGAIRLGATGNLFAVGGQQNFRVIAGDVDETGAIISGAGFTALRAGTGEYTVSFTTPFPVVPVVVASPIDAIADDNVVTIINLTNASFRIRTTDVNSAVAGELQDTRFTFIALGAQ